MIVNVLEFQQINKLAEAILGNLSASYKLSAEIPKNNYLTTATLPYHRHIPRKHLPLPVEILDFHDIDEHARIYHVAVGAAVPAELGLVGFKVLIFKHHLAPAVVDPHRAHQHDFRAGEYREKVVQLDGLGSDDVRQKDALRFLYDHEHFVAGEASCCVYHSERIYMAVRRPDHAG